MTNKFYYALITALTLFFCAVAYCFAQDGTYVATCVRVIDGDTITVADENQNLHRIRIVGMDAPELAQPYGRAAKAALSELVLHKEVHVVPAGVDKYDRELAELRYDTSFGQLDVAETMISNGQVFPGVGPTTRPRITLPKTAWAFGLICATRSGLGFIAGGWP